ncbi:MAG: toxin-antitoxin system YwqK family antitoxin [Pirellulales bacterium]
MFKILSKKTAGLALGLALAGWSLADAAPPTARRLGPGGVLNAQTRIEQVETAAAESDDIDDAQDTDEKPRQELIQERYPNGNIRVQRYVTQDADGNYVNHGAFVQYSQTGQKTGAGEYYLGRHHGTWVRWYEPNEGSLLDTQVHKLFQKPFVSEVQLYDGQLHGTWTVYDARRLKVSIWRFEHGQRHGKSVWMYPNGQRAREVDYQNGVINGKLLAWNMKDQLTEDETFINGRRLAKTTYWHAPGKKRVEGDTLFAKQPVESKYDWWNANIVYANAADAGVDEKSGLWTWWYANGQKFCEGRFLDNAPTGKWVFWHQNGQKQMEGSYIAGQQVDRWTTWAEDGVLLNVETRQLSEAPAEDEYFQAEEYEEAPPVTADGESSEESTARIGRLRIPAFR